MRLGITYDEFGNESQPDGPPGISYPFKGDSLPGTYPWYILNSAGIYVEVPLGQGYNIQPPNQNALAFMIEQEFMVRASSYVPMALNTNYQDWWSLGWAGPVDLSQALLVKEGDLKMMAGGMGKVRRHFASIPPQRNSYESFTFKFPGLNWLDGNIRKEKSLTVNSRIQSDYFLLTDGADLPHVFPQFTIYDTTSDPNAVIMNLTVEDLQQTDPGEGYTVTILGITFSGVTVAPTPGTVPPTESYATLIGQAEIVAEASKLNPWMGNIYERITRFVVIA